jgi:hypothetical protein
MSTTTEMWAANCQTAAAQLKRLPEFTHRELARLLHGSDTCAQTKAEIVKRLRRRTADVPSAATSPAPTARKS